MHPQVAGNVLISHQALFILWSWPSCNIIEVKILKLADLKTDLVNYSINIIFGLLDIKWVLPETVKEVLTSWKGSFVGKKRKQIWKSIPLCIFWTVWKERNRLAFRGSVVNVQRLKNSFVCNLWNWAKVYLGEEAFSLIGFLEWIASTWGEVVLSGPFLFWGCIHLVYSLYALWRLAFFNALLFTYQKKKKKN